MFQNMLTSRLVVAVMLVFMACNPSETTTSSDGSVTLYAVTTGADSTFAAEPSIEPIAVFRNGNFEKPIPTLPENSTTEAFDQALSKASLRFFPANGSFFLYSGGTLNGKALILPSTESEGGTVTGLLSPVKLEAKTLNAERFAVAANSDKFSVSNRVVRPLSAQERAAILPIARTTFAQNGVSAALLDSIQTQAIRVYNIDGQGTDTIIGDFIIEHRSSSSEGDATISRELLFVIIEKEQGNFVIRTSTFGSSGEFVTEESQMIDLVDVLDLDGDGTFEVFARRNMAETYDFVIYKKQRNGWKMIYQGGGGGIN